MYDCLETTNSLYIFMEKLVEGNLSDYLDTNYFSKDIPIPEDFIIDFAF